MDLFREKLEAGRSLRIAFDDFDGINLEIRKKCAAETKLFKFKNYHFKVFNRLILFSEY